MMQGTFFVGIQMYKGRVQWESTVDFLVAQQKGKHKHSPWLALARRKKCIVISKRKLAFQGTSFLRSVLDIDVPVGLNLLWGLWGWFRPLLGWCWCVCKWLPHLYLSWGLLWELQTPLPNICTWLPQSTSDLTCTKLNSWFLSPLPCFSSQEMVPSHQASQGPEIFPWLLPTFHLSHSVTKSCWFYSLSVSSISLLFIPVFGEKDMAF